MVVCRFDKGIERVGCGYVREVRTSRCVDVPAHSLYDDLGQLSSGHVGERSERVVCIPRDDAAVVRCLDECVEDVGRVYISKVRGTREINRPMACYDDDLGELPTVVLL